MRLGIAVVYLFDSETEWLLDLHLQQIERNTTVPFTIYASVNRLAAPYARRLEASPHVKICSIPDTDQRGQPEHAYYLDHLVSAAIAGGATHVVTLHLDSFPVRPGWAERLAATLDDRHAFATLDVIHSGCLFFSRDFFLQSRPAFWPSADVRGSREYQEYVRTCRPVEHSGVGYSFAAYLDQREGYYLTSAGPLFGNLGDVFDESVFHLGAAVRSTERPATTSESAMTLYGQCVDAAARVYGALVPLRIRHAVRRTFQKTRLGQFIDAPRASAMFERELRHRAEMRELLVSDLQSFLRRKSPR